MEFPYGINRIDVKEQKDMIRIRENNTGVIKLKYRIMIMIATMVMLLIGAVCLYSLGFGKGIPMVCPIYECTGLYCPGCGSGRACYSILHGQFYQAFRYNPLMVILLPWIGLYYLICEMQWLITGKETFSSKVYWKIPAVILEIIMIYGIIRNINVYPFKLLAPTPV